VPKGGPAVDKIKKLWHYLTSPQMILYLIFGILTTAINVVACGVCYDVLRWNILAANTFAWVVAVIFAFLTNKVYVFKSKSFAADVVWRELAGFLGARLFSPWVGTLGVWLMVGAAPGNVWISKILINILVIIINYILSKFFIFKNQ
jgi:putative flippase GtrA